jgi:hypothetical protein
MSKISETIESFYADDFWGIDEDKYLSSSEWIEDRVKTVLKGGALIFGTVATIVLLNKLANKISENTNNKDKVKKISKFEDIVKFIQEKSSTLEKLTKNCMASKYHSKMEYLDISNNNSLMDKGLKTLESKYSNVELVIGGFWFKEYKDYVQWIKDYGGFKDWNDGEHRIMRHIYTDWDKLKELQTYVEKLKLPHINSHLTAYLDDLAGSIVICCKYDPKQV